MDHHLDLNGPFDIHEKGFGPIVIQTLKEKKHSF